MKRYFVTSSLKLSFLSVCVVWLAACSSSGQPNSTVALEGSEWRLLQLGGDTIDAADYQNEPNIVLLSEQKRVAGSGGCNRLMGSYALDGKNLKFSQLAGTMMACPKGMETERQFHQMMEAVAGWRIADDKLEFFDTAGTTIAVFERLLKQ